ncbi:MAG: energy transducer TonB [Gemmatimonadota bacterium]
MLAGSATAQQIPDDNKPFALPEYSCAAADSLLGPRRPSGVVLSSSGDATFASFDLPQSGAQKRNGRLHLRLKIEAMGGALPAPSPMEFHIVLNGAPLHAYRASPPPHPFELIVDDTIRLRPSLAELDLASGPAPSEVTLAGRIIGSDAVRFAAGHSAVARLAGGENRIGSEFMDQVNTTYRASLCGLAAGWPLAGDAIKVTYDRGPIARSVDASGATGDSPPSTGASSPRVPVDGVYRAQDVSPRPSVRVMSSPPYPPEMKGRQIPGTVKLRFVVGSDGRVEAGSIEIVESTNESFAHYAIDGVTHTEFNPGLLHGQPVRVRVEARVEFRGQ